MITLYTLEEIQEISTISGAFKEELKSYFKEIAEGIVGDGWQSYNFEDVGPILVIEKQDTIDILDEYGVMQGGKAIPIALPEFAIRARIEDKEILRIIWVCGDSFGLSVYYPTGQFGKEFDEYIMEFVIK